MVTKPKREYATVWYITYALAALLTLPLESILPIWPSVMSWLVWVPVGLFVIVEGIAVFNDTFGDTKTEFTRYRIKNPRLRWGIGIWLAFLALWRIPGVLGTIVGAGLLLWLPLHFAVAGIEKEIWKSFSSLWKRD